MRMSNKPARLQFFLKEQWAVRKAREHKVPVPEILEVGNELDGYPYMILEKISGQSGEDGGDRLRTLRELAGYTRTIHSIQTNGFGHVFDWSTNLLSSNETWSAFLTDEYQIKARLEQFRKQKIFTSQTSSRLESAVKKLQSLQFKPALNHGDIRLKNVILDEKGGLKRSLIGRIVFPVRHHIGTFLLHCMILRLTRRKRLLRATIFHSPISTASDLRCERSTFSIITKHSSQREPKRTRHKFVGFEPDSMELSIFLSFREPSNSLGRR